MLVALALQTIMEAQEAILSFHLLHLQVAAQALEVEMAQAVVLVVAARITEQAVRRPHQHKAMRVVLVTLLHREILTMALAVAALVAWGKILLA